MYSEVGQHIAMNEPFYQRYLSICNESLHSAHVADYTRILCIKMDLSNEEVQDISDAALLHDLGKIMVPAEILSKSEVLNENEYEIMKKHCDHGYNMLRSQNDSFFDFAAGIVREHHEHVDGSGYMGLNHKEICLGARIIAVADVFDALLSKRCYKDMWSYDAAYRYILEYRNVYFDPEVVDVFMESQSDIRKVYKAYSDMSVRID